MTGWMTETLSKYCHRGIQRCLGEEAIINTGYYKPCQACPEQTGYKADMFTLYQKLAQLKMGSRDPGNTFSGNRSESGT